MQVVADDLDVGPLAREVVLRGTADLLSERIVLADDVHLLDGLVFRQHSGHRLHFHVGVGVETEMPEAAFAVGHVRVERAVVQVHDLLAGVAFVVFVDGVDQRQSDTRATALRHVADTLVDGGLELRQRFLRGAFAVQRDDLKRVVARPFALPTEFRHELPASEQVLANGCERP